MLVYDFLHNPKNYINDKNKLIDIYNELLTLTNTGSQQLDEFYNIYGYKELRPVKNTHTTLELIKFMSNTKHNNKFLVDFEYVLSKYLFLINKLQDKNKIFNKSELLNNSEIIDMSEMPAIEYNLDDPKYDPVRNDFILLQSGGSLSQDTIRLFDTRNINNIILKNDNIKISFPKNENKQIFDNNNYYSRGFVNAIYKVKINDSKTSYILRLLKHANNIDADNHINNYIDKYKSDLTIDDKLKKNFIDIIYYGTINKNNNYFTYVITHYYNTDNLLLNKLLFINKYKFLMNVIEMLQIFLNKGYLVSDLKLNNISIDNNLNPILIDYDMNTITNDIHIFYNTTQNIYGYHDDTNNKSKRDKIYHIFLAELIYFLYVIPESNILFNNIFIKKSNLKQFINKNYNISDYNKILNDSNYLGIEEILFKNNRGLISVDYNNILSLDEIKNKLLFIIAKPPKNMNFQLNTINKIKYYLPDSSKYFVNEYGVGIKNYNNPNFYKFNYAHELQKLSYTDKFKQNFYYVLVNNWDIKYYEDDKDTNINNETLRYALQSIGCIHTVKFNGKGNPPEYVLHLNNDFKNKYGGYFDNCRLMEDSLFVLTYWIIEITNLFNIISEKYDLNKIIYINVMDHPINKGIYPIGTDITKHPYPDIISFTKDIKIPITATPTDLIYCWAPKKGYLDIGLPFHDIQQHIFGYFFGNKFNIDTYLNNKYINYKLEDKIPKALFRGSHTNCGYPIKNTIRLISHLRTLQNSSIIDSYVTDGYRFTYFNNTKLKFNDITFYSTKDKFLDADKQPEYRYILNLDGFASAFRIVKELYYNSILIIPDSEYTDVIRNILEPWKHYIPVNADLSNLENTIIWCNNNIDKLNIILNNVKELRDNIIKFDIMLDFTFNKLTVNKFNKLTDVISFDTSKQLTIPISTITNDIIKSLGKKGTIEWISNGNVIKSEDIYYKKYLKYKQKYLALKNSTQ